MTAICVMTLDSTQHRARSASNVSHKRNVSLHTRSQTHITHTTLGTFALKTCSKKKCLHIIYGGHVHTTAHAKRRFCASPVRSRRGQRGADTTTPYLAEHTNKAFFYFCCTDRVQSAIDNRFSAARTESL